MSHNPKFDFKSLAFDTESSGGNKWADTLLHVSVVHDEVMLSGQPQMVAQQAQKLIAAQTRQYAKHASFGLMYGMSPNNLKQALNYRLQSGDLFGNRWWDRDPPPLTLEQIVNTPDPLAALVDQLVEITNVLIDEHLLQNHVDPLKIELIALMRLFISTQPYSSSGEYRYGKLSVFDTGMGITIRLFQPENADRVPPHDLVYNTVRSYETKRRLRLKGEAPLVEANWDPELAHEAIDLLKQATVLDQLAKVRDESA